MAEYRGIEYEHKPDENFTYWSVFIKSDIGCGFLRAKSPALMESVIDSHLYHVEHPDVPDPRRRTRFDPSYDGSDTLGCIRIDGTWMDYARGTEAEVRKWVSADPTNRRMVDWLTYQPID